MHWIQYKSEWQDSYSRFSNNNFGTSAYQGTMGYLSWLYTENPNQHSIEDGLILGIVDGEIVACLHTMMLAWMVDSSVFRMPTVHDIMVSEAYRGGMGAVMLLKALRMTRHAYISAATGEMDEMYRTLGCQPIRACWYRRVLTPVRGAMALVAWRAGLRHKQAAYFGGDTPLVNGWELTSEPDQALIAAVGERLAKSDENSVRPDWNRDQTKWRFFHALGPNHMLIYRVMGSSIGDMAKVSRSPHKCVFFKRLFTVMKKIACRSCGLLTPSRFSTHSI